MNLIRQKTNQCLITSLAMVVNEPTDLIAARINATILHIQECQDYVHNWHKSHLVNIIRIPILNNRGKLRKCGNERRFKGYLKRSTAILISETHAYAWDGKKCYDPRGEILGSIPDDVDEAFIIIKSVS